MNQSVVALLHDGVQQLALNLSATAEEKLGNYVRLLDKWNGIYNLTAIRDQREMVSKHLLDSLSVLPSLLNQPTRLGSLADVGSGGGLPGIPLAIACPDLVVTLIEANQKKAAFLEQAKIELKLDNVSIYCGRAELFKPVHLFDLVISRALSTLADFIQLAAHLLAPCGRLLAMKGIYPQEEIDQLPSGWKVFESTSLVIPGLSARREIIVIEKA